MEDNIKSKQKQFGQHNGTWYRAVTADTNESDYFGVFSLACCRILLLDEMLTRNDRIKQGRNILVSNFVVPIRTAKQSTQVAKKRIRLT